jgi:hypothetical protein
VSPPPPASRARAGLLAAAAGWLAFGGAHLAATTRAQGAYVGAGIAFVVLVGGGSLAVSARAAEVGRRGVALAALLPLGAHLAWPSFYPGAARSAAGLLAGLLVVSVCAAILRSRGASSPALSACAFALPTLAIATQLGDGKLSRTAWHLGAAACAAVAAMCFRAWQELGEDDA